MTDLDLVTGELLPATARLTPAEAGERAAWVREMKKSVLVTGVDYGTLPGTSKPVLWKSGAESLLQAAGFGSTMTRVDDQASAVHEGITYRCTVLAGDVVRATCDGYAGYDESRFHYAKGRRADWNTIVKMAQKRALVGAVLNACAASGLFVADLEDDTATGAESVDQVVSGDERAVLRRAITALPEETTAWLLGMAKADKIPNIDGPKFLRSHRDRLAWHLLAAPAAVDEPAPPAAYYDDPETTPDNIDEVEEEQ